MNFYDLCYNKVIYYMTNFYGVDQKEIEEFITDVRVDNPVYSAIQKMVKVMASNVPLRWLEVRGRGDYL